MTTAIISSQAGKTDLLHWMQYRSCSLILPQHSITGRLEEQLSLCITNHMLSDACAPACRCLTSCCLTSTSKFSLIKQEHPFYKFTKFNVLASKGVSVQTRVLIKNKGLDSILNPFTWAWAQPIPQTFLCTAEKKGISCTRFDSSDPISFLQLLGYNPCVQAKIYFPH